MSESPYILEGEFTLWPGEIRTYNMNWPEFDAVSSGVSAAYVAGSTVGILTGSEVEAGNIHTMRTITIPADYGGNTVIVTSQVDVGTERFIKGIVIRVLQPGETP